MAEVPVFKARFALVNEDGEEYETHDDIDSALSALLRFPNDHIEVTLHREGVTFDEWLVTGRDAEGNRKRLVLHQADFDNAAQAALELADHNWGEGSQVDSVVRQEPEEYDFSCQICGDPRGH